MITEDQKRKIENKYQMLALTNWAKFNEMVNIDWTQVFICEQKAKGLSLQQIADKLNSDRSFVQYRCKKCSKF